MLVSLAEMEVSFENNTKQAEEFSIMSECAENQAYVDVKAL